MSAGRLKCYGWGREGEGMTAAERDFVLGRCHEKFGRDAFETLTVPGWATVLGWMVNYRKAV